MNKKTILLILSLTFVLVILPFKVLADDPGLIKSGVKIVVNPGATSTTVSTGRCENSITSCGKDGNCVDLTGLTYCVDGKIVETVCKYNNPMNQTTSVNCKYVNFNLAAKDDNGFQIPINITLYEPGTDTIIKKLNLNGLTSLDIFHEKADFDIDYDDSNLVIKIKDLGIKELDSTSPNIIIDDNVDPSIPEIEVYKAYKVELPSNFNYSSIALTFKYSDEDVREEDNLVFYKCSSFDSDTNKCNGDWKVIRNVNIDYVNKLVSINISGFSVYALGETEDETISEQTCEDFGYSESCSGDTECEVVQPTSDLECCDCVPIETTTTYQETEDYSSSSGGSSSGGTSYSSGSSYQTTTTILECFENEPYISVEPLSQSGTVGDTLKYNITLNNMDSIDCESRELELEFNAPEGWLLDYDPIGEIEPGDMKVVEIMVTSPEENSANGTHQLSAFASDIYTGEQSNEVNFEYVANNLPELELEEEVEVTQSSSPTTGFVTFVSKNKLFIISPIVVVILGYIIWKNYFIWGNTGISQDYAGINNNEGPREEIVLRLEPEKKPENNKIKKESDQEPKDEKTKKAVIEEIRRKALKEDEKIRRNL